MEAPGSKKHPMDWPGLTRMLSPAPLAAEGIEAFTDNPQVAQIEHIPGDDAGGYTQIRSQIEKPLEPDLAAVVAVWPSLSAPLRAAIVAIANTATNKGDL